MSSKLILMTCLSVVQAVAQTPGQKAFDTFQRQNEMSRRFVAQQFAKQKKQAQQAQLAAHLASALVSTPPPEPTKDAWTGPSSVIDFYPCQAGKSILLITEKPNTLQLRDASTGSVRWQNPLGSELLLTPIEISGKVFYVSKDSVGTLLDLETGKPCTNLPIENYDAFRISGKQYHTRILPPVVVNDALIVAVYGKGKQSGNAEGKIQAFEIATGKAVWEFSIPGGPELLPTAFDQNLIVGGNGVIYCLEARTGKALWNTTVRPDDEAAELDYGFAENGRLFVTCAKQRIALDMTTGKELWRAKVNSKGTSVLTGEKDAVSFLEERGLIAPDYWLVTVEAATGKLLWDIKLGESVSIGGSHVPITFPLAQDGTILCHNASDLLLLDLNTGKQLWKTSLPAIPMAPFIPVGTQLYTACHKRWTSTMAAVDLKDGHLCWKRELTTPYLEGPIAVDAKGIFYIGDGKKLIRLQ